MEKLPIVTIAKKTDEDFLRRKTTPFSIGNGKFKHGGKVFSKTELNQLLMQMRKTMRLAYGVGLSSNQIGLDYRLFVAEVPDKDGNLKFYAIFNPELETVSSKEVLEEGCLSVPGQYGEIARHERVILRGWDKNCKPVKIKAWGLLAQVFQHEVDHLDGKLFIDRAKNIHSKTREERTQKIAKMRGGQE